MSKVLTTCPYCGCGCGLYLEVEDNEIIGVFPSQSHPVSKGSLCIRGWKVDEFVESENRLRKPLMRENSKSQIPNPKFKEASWDEALGLTANRFKEIKEKYGGQAIGVIASAKITNEENYLLQKFARCALSTNNIDTSVRLYQSPSLIGLKKAFGLGIPPNSISDIEEAELILLSGANLTSSTPQVASRVLKAKKKGAKLIVVDPRRIQLSSSADLYLQPKPGTDLIWINGMINAIISKNLSKEEFITKRSENYEALKKSVLKYTPDYAERITGIPASKLEEASLLYAKSRSMIIYSSGITQHVSGTNTVLALSNLSLLTGNIEKRGSGIFPLIDQNNGQGANDLGCLPEFYPGYQEVADSRVREKFESAWKVKLPSDSGLTLMEMIKEASSGGIKALYIVGENPLICCANLNLVRKALENLEFLVVQDLFLTETAKLADVVLPAVSFAEREGTFTNLEGRLQRVRKIIEPRGDSKPDLEIVCKLSNLLGYRMDYVDAREVMEEVSRLTPLYEKVNYRDLEELGGLPRGELLPQGKARFFAVDYSPPSEVTNNEYPFILSVGREKPHLGGAAMSKNSPTLIREMPSSFVQINPEDAKELEIREGWKVKVITRRGELVIACQITGEVLSGMLFIPMHFGANILTNSALDKDSKIPEFKVCAAKIETI